MNNKNFIIIILSLSFFIGCSTTKFHPVRWDKKEFKDYNYKYVFWKEGIQFVEVKLDDFIIRVSGFLTINYIAYFFVSIYNDSDKKITFYPGYCNLLIQGKEFKPLGPNYIRKVIGAKENLHYFSFIANVLSIGLSASHNNNINVIPYYKDKIELEGYKLSEKLREINTEENNLIDILLKNNEILPQESYSGLLIFDKVYDRSIPFELFINIWKYKFSVRGKFMDGNSYDEYDLPENIDTISFE